MIVQSVLKTDSLENVINGKFVFCKELKKGFIKGNITTLGVVSFEDVANAIEGLTLEELQTKGLNTVIFVNGEEKISQKANLEIEAIIAEMENPTAEMILSLQSDRRLKRNYFDESFVQNIVDNLVASYYFDITTPLKMIYDKINVLNIENNNGELLIESTDDELSGDFGYAIIPIPITESCKFKIQITDRNPSFGIAQDFDAVGAWGPSIVIDAIDYTTLNKIYEMTINFENNIFSIFGCDINGVPDTEVGYWMDNANLSNILSTGTVYFEIAKYGSAEYNGKVKILSVEAL